MSNGVKGPHIMDALIQIGCNNPVKEILNGSTGSGGPLSVIFPNFEAALNWFRSFNENSLASLSILKKFTPKSPFTGNGKIASPVGLPHVPGLFERGR